MIHPEQTAPVIVTCGEPAGIGPEIAHKARLILGERVPFAFLGDPRHLPSECKYVEITDLAQVVDVPGDILPLLPHSFSEPVQVGTPNPAHAQSVIDVIYRAVKLVQTGHALAICTSPIHKKALQSAAGFAFPGHTEYLAHLADVKNVVMMLVSPMLRVVPATIHIALREVTCTLTPQLLEKTLILTHAALISDFGVPAPRIAVAGLNPHAGEDGAMGLEELDLIIPVIERLRARGMNILGPSSADTMFHEAARARYDVAVCMYHDQALIPLKTLDFAGGVNITLGLPFVRTSPDHGTAFDIAGRGVADPMSMIAALEMAQNLAKVRTAKKGTVNGQS